MDTRKVAIEYRLAQWTQRLQARVNSGQSIKAYCVSTGISKNTYFYWQRKLREATCEKLSGESAKELAPCGWTRVAAGVASSEEVSVAVEIGGCRIQVTAGTDMGLLVKTCRALKTV